MKKLDELIGRRAMRIDSPEDYVEWAVEELAGGCNIENVAILAGLDIPRPIDRQEVEYYFDLCLKDLAITVRDPQTTMQKYSVEVANEISAGIRDPFEGLNILSHLWAASDYEESLYWIWDYIAEDIAYLDTEGTTIYSGIPADMSVGEYVRAEAKLYSKLSQESLPENFARLAFCSKCEKLVETTASLDGKRWIPRFVYRVLWGRVPSCISSCKVCGHTGVAHMNSFEGRRVFVAAKEWNR